MSKQYNYTLQNQQVSSGIHKKTSTSIGSKTGQYSQPVTCLWQENDEFASKGAIGDGKSQLQGISRVSVTCNTTKNQEGCKHAELISYKVHKDQFKSLLVPSQKGYNGTIKMANQCKSGKNSGVQDPNQSKLSGDNFTQASDAAEIDSAYLNQEQDDSDDEMRSTDGEESDPNSPLVPDSQYLNQSNDLKAALINSKALVGDYVELKNCKRCGSMIFKDLSAAIKPKSAEFNADISPAQLLTKMFQDEARYKFDHYIPTKDLALRENKIARLYIEQRNILVERIFLMGKKFNQRTKTLHIAIELMDRFFLDKRSQSNQDIQSMTARILSIFLTTCFLIASKYDEIDDQLVFINDVQRYYSRLGPQFSQQNMNPSYTDIVETERMLMHFFDWDLGFVMPIHFVEMFLANGVLFETEYNTNIVKDRSTAERIQNRSYDVLNEMIKQNTCFKNQGFSGNQVASMVVFTARQEVLNLSKARHIWPKELQLISRQTEKQVKKLATHYKKGVNIDRIEPFAEDTVANEQTKYSLGHIVDLTKQSSQTHVLNYQTALVSPKAHKINEKYSSEKRNTAEKVPVAQIVIPMAKKLQQSSQKDQMSNSKVVSQYKIKETNSGVKNSLEAAKNMPFRTKKMSLMRANTNGCAKLTKIPISNQKEPSGSESQKHFVSAQKCEDGKSKLFAERRVSQNNGISNARSNNESSLSLRMKPQTLCSTNNIATSSSNRNLRSGQKNQTITGSTGKQFNYHRLQSQKSSSSFKNSGIGNGLRINSARQDIVGVNNSQISSNVGSQVAPHTTKNACFTPGSTAPSQVQQYRTKLQSKYGINAQNKMIANGSLNNSQSSSSALQNQTGVKSYQCSLSGSKTNPNSRLQHIWKRPSLPSVSQNSSSNKRFENPYVYHRTNTSKDLHNSVSNTLVAAGEPSRASFSSVVEPAPRLRQPIKQRDNSEQATLKERTFQRAGHSQARETIQAFKDATRRTAGSSLQHNLVGTSSESAVEPLPTALHRCTSKPRDIRDATSVREVREIMNQVKSKYRNAYYNKTVDSSSTSAHHQSVSYENLRL